MPTRKEIVAALKDAQINIDILNVLISGSISDNRYLKELAGQVENMRCTKCGYTWDAEPMNTRDTDLLLKEMAEAFEVIIRCLSHGLQDCKASITAKAILQKYHEQVGE